MSSTSRSDSPDLLESASQPTPRTRPTGRRINVVDPEEEARAVQVSIDREVDMEETRAMQREWTESRRAQRRMEKADAMAAEAERRREETSKRKAQYDPKERKRRETQAAVADLEEMN